MSTKQTRHVTFRKGKSEIQVAFNRISVSIYDVRKVLEGKLALGKVTVVLPPSDERKLGIKGRLMHKLSERDLREIVMNQLRNDVVSREQYVIKLKELLALDEKALKQSRSVARAWTKLKVG